MRPSFLRFAVLACLLLSGYPLRALTVSIDTESATSVLQALADPSLTYDRALEIAKLPGNQGIIRKMREFDIPATKESFATALVAAAKGQEVTQPNETIFMFPMVKSESATLTALLRNINEHPEEFARRIEQRVAMFSPTNLNMKLQGYVVAGGDGGGYAFDEPFFYLNIGLVDDIAFARETTMHELYHAVQGAYPVNSKKMWTDPPAADAAGRARQQTCANVANLYWDVVKEGTAELVGDPAQLSGAKGEGAKGEIVQRVLTDLADGEKHVADSVTLLELSTIGLEAHEPADPEKVYALGFYGHGILYNIGYTMAKAVVAAEGPQALVTYIDKPAYTFMEHYTSLPLYGKDRAHPKLGPNTVAALKMLAAGCE